MVISLCHPGVRGIPNKALFSVVCFKLYSKVGKYYINFEQNISVINTKSVALNICQSYVNHRKSAMKNIFCNILSV